MLDYYRWLQYIDIAAYSLSCAATAEIARRRKQTRA
jgi:hypothetical protein